LNESDISDPKDEQTSNLMDRNADRIYRAAKEAGSLEVWLMDKHDSSFTHAEGGTWIDYYFHEQHPSDALE
jgi:hypothetical protein